MAYESYIPISYTLVGNGGEYASRPFERKGGTIAQPSAGVSGVGLPADDMVGRAVTPPDDDLAGSGDPHAAKLPGRVKYPNLVLKRGKS